MAEDIDFKKKLAASDGGEPRPDDSGREDCEKQRDEYLAGWQRARADFLNYKKEEMERLVELMKYGAEEMILKILPILDNFEVAEKKISDNDHDRDSDNLKGLLQIINQLRDFLKSQGVEEIKAMGEKFDPNWHEVVEEVAENGSPQTIIEEVQRGYKINGRLLRPAKVKVVK